ncbi:MAG: pyruvate ferredoxin oxidoreductase [Oscillospiraceae bacterium]|jgi:pyruvate ferredoxin oxidoreductase alpha subunit|nr:pyruvate ferredoxin oxidoreductase [Oscillospiraceae bacterium]
MAEYMMLDGNAAAVQGMAMSRVKVVAAYPITPQSSIAERLSDLVASGELQATYMRVESEHSALSATLGAQLAGVRAGTATSSVGLALMHEICNAASGMRVPIVMPVVNRALASPWSLWCDHQDSMAERDSGWLQLYCQNVQEIYDLTLMAYRLAEHERVLLPAMVCFDGFFLSHSMQKVAVPAQAEVDSFVGPYTPKNVWLDPTDPVFINDLITMEEFTEMKYQMKEGFASAADVFNEVSAEFAERFGRRYCAAEGYMTEDAEAVIVSLGSMSGTVRHVVREMRSRGEKVGALKVTCFRPFPQKEVARLLAGVGRVAVFDRSAGLGAAGGPLFLEVKDALDGKAFVKNYIGGLGGRDVGASTVERVFADLRAAREEDDRAPVWCDVKEHPMQIRQVLRFV